MVSALSFRRHCLTTDQLVYRRATQTTENKYRKYNITWLRIPSGGGKPVGYLQAQPKDLITRDCRETNP